MFLAGLGPATKGLADGHEVELGELLGELGLGLGRDGALRPRAVAAISRARGCWRVMVLSRNASSF